MKSVPFMVYVTKELAQTLLATTSVDPLLDWSDHIVLASPSSLNPALRDKLVPVRTACAIMDPTGSKGLEVMVGTSRTSFTAVTMAHSLTDVTAEDYAATVGYTDGIAIKQCGLVETCHQIHSRSLLSNLLPESLRVRDLHERPWLLMTVQATRDETSGALTLVLYYRERVKSGLLQTALYQLRPVALTDALTMSNTSQDADVNYGHTAFDSITNQMLVPMSFPEFVTAQWPLNYADTNKISGTAKPLKWRTASVGQPDPVPGDPALMGGWFQNVVANQVFSNMSSVGDVELTPILFSATHMVYAVEDDAPLTPERAQQVVCNDAGHSYSGMDEIISPDTRSYIVTRPVHFGVGTFDLSEFIKRSTNLVNRNVLLGVLSPEHSTMNLCGAQLVHYDQESSYQIKIKTWYVGQLIMSPSAVTVNADGSERTYELLSLHPDLYAEYLPWLSTFEVDLRNRKFHDNYVES